MPNKKSRRDNNGGSKWWKWLIIIGVILIVLIIGGFLGFRSYYNSQLEPVDPTASEESIKEIEIPSNSSIDTIANTLEDEGIINDSLSFKIYTQMNDASNLQAGYYQLSPGQSTGEVVQALQEGGSAVSQESIVTLTFPEGSNVLDVAAIIAQNTEYTEDDVIEVLEDESFVDSMFNNYPVLFENYPVDDPNILYTLEGYLYPATYDFMLEDDLTVWVEQMVAQTNQVYADIIEEIADESFTFHELLTLSAIVEHEAANEDDRRLIAGVFLNRLDIGMNLETNVSFAYLEGEHKETVSYEDTEVDSPYNLYRNSGLGPGPINNPSINSTQAVLNPEESDYLFFLSDIYTEKTYFSETYEEHLEKQEIYVNGNDGSTSSQDNNSNE